MSKGWGRLEEDMGSFKYFYAMLLARYLRIKLVQHTPGMCSCDQPCMDIIMFSCESIHGS